MALPATPRVVEMTIGTRKRLDGSELDGSEHFENIAKMSLELLGLLLELLLELLLLLLYAFIT